jgi:hypothetical protein
VTNGSRYAETTALLRRCFMGQEGEKRRRGSRQGLISAIAGLVRQKVAENTEPLLIFNMLVSGD